MNKKAVTFGRNNIVGYPEKTNTVTDNLIKDIVERTTQVAVNKADEVEVMQTMLNDKEFSVAVFDRNKGYMGSRSPRNEAIQLAVDTLSGVTGMSTVEAHALTENYEYTKRDAAHFINIGKDFIGTYLQSGRKMTLISEPRIEATVSLKHVEEHDKSVPDRDNPGSVKVVKTPECIKLVASSRR